MLRCPCTPWASLLTTMLIPIRLHILFWPPVPLLLLLLCGAAADSSSMVKKGSAAASQASQNQTQKKVLKDPGSKPGPKAAWKPTFLRWKGCPPAICLGCDQKTDQLDRDSPEGKEEYLWWVQSRTSPKINKGKPYPSGNECYHCYDTRRKHFNNIKLVPLLNKRKLKPKCDARFWKRRRATVRKEVVETESEDEVMSDMGVGPTAPKKGSGNITTAEEEKAFERQFVTGSFEPLQQFAFKRRIEYDSVDELKDIVMERYKSYTLTTNKAGVLGVEIVHQIGGSYMLERGMEDSNVLKREEEHDDDDDAAEAHSVNAGLKDTNASQRALNEPIDDTEGDSDHQSPSDDAGSVNRSMISTQLPRTSPRSVVSAASSPRSNRSDTVTLASRRRAPTPVKSSSARGSLRGGGGGRSRASSVSNAPDVLADAEGEVDLCADEDQDQDPGDAEAKRSLCDRFIADANRTMAKIMKSFGNDAHFDNSKQKTSCATAVNRLRTWGRKTGKYQNEESQKTSLMCFNMADEIEERQVTFDVAKSEFPSLVITSPSPARMTVLKDLPDSFFANMIVQGCTTISTQALTSEEHAQAFIFALVGEEPAGTTLVGVGLRMIMRHPGGAKLVKTTQRSALLDHLEKVLKQGDKVKMLNSSLVVSCPAMGDSKFQDIKDSVDLVPSPSDATTDEYFVRGWCPSLWLDLVSVYTMGKIGMALSKKTKPDFALLDLSRAIIDNQSKLDARVRCYHKAMTGVQNSASKQIWSTMTELSNTTTKVNAYKFDASDVKKSIKSLTDAEASDDVGVMADTLVEICLTPDGTELKHFGQWAASLAETSDTKEARLLAKQLVQAFMGLLAKFLQKNDYHVAVLDGTIVPVALPLEGDSGASAIVRDDIYFSDMDNLPEEVAFVSVIHAACTMLKNFAIDNETVVQEAGERAELVLKLWKVSNCQLTSEFSDCDRLKRYTEINRSSIWAADRSGQTRIKDSGNPMFHVQAFIDKTVDCNRVTVLITRLLEAHLMSGGPNAVSLSREAHALQCSLPRETHELLKCHKKSSPQKKCMCEFSLARTCPLWQMSTTCFMVLRMPKHFTLRQAWF